MSNRTIIVTVISAALLLLGWFVQQHPVSLLPTSQPPRPQPAIAAPPLSDPPKEQASQPAAAIPEESTQLKVPKVTEPITAEKAARSDNQAPNLTEYNYSSPRKKVRTIEITPGVTVKDKVVHFDLEQGPDKSLELERNPASSDNDYQLMWRNKF